MAPSDAATRVLESFGFTFPPVGIAVITYALLGDPVFAVNRFIGFRLHRGLRVALRRLYLLCNGAFFALLGGVLLWGCGAPPPGPDGATGVCGARPLHARPCLASVAVVAVGHLLCLLCDRVFVPLLCIEGHVGFVSGWRRRLVEAASAGVMWLTLGHADGAAVALAVVLAARRAVGSVLLEPRARLVVLVAKLVPIAHAGRVLAAEDACSKTQRQMALAVLGTALML